MAVRPVVKYPDPFLREQSVPVDEITSDIRQLVQDMTDTMYAAEGAGFAAIQMGRLERVYIVEARAAGLDENEPPVVFINPEVLETSEETEISDEGCLSFPGIYVPVERPLRAKVRATGLDGKEFIVNGEGLYARAMLHEGDHLTGKLLADFMRPLKREMVKRKLKRDAKRAAKEAGDNPPGGDGGALPRAGLARRGGDAKRRPSVDSDPTR